MKKIKFFKIIHSFLCSIGLNFLKFKNILYMQKYFRDLYNYKKKGGKINYFFPIISDHKEEAGSFDKQYFYQDIIVAQEIYHKRPEKHVDVGSRLDGFVSNVASFRQIEVFDIRPLNIEIKNIKFKKIDLMDIGENFQDYSDSVSCLHTIEHLGLGRYGDKIDPKAYLTGIYNLQKIIKRDGYLYLSMPISNNTKIYFNSERVFDPFEILNINKELEYVKFHFIDDEGKIFLNYDVQNLKNKVFDYSCGIFIFKKK